MFGWKKENRGKGSFLVFGTKDGKEGKKDIRSKIVNKIINLSRREILYTLQKLLLTPNTKFISYFILHSTQPFLFFLFWKCISGILQWLPDLYFRKPMRVSGNAFSEVIQS